MWEQGVMAKFMVLSWHLPGGAEESHKYFNNIIFQHPVALVFSIYVCTTTVSGATFLFSSVFICN
jgi:hypothetical protein